jgi:hypothetical protein
MHPARPLVFSRTRFKLSICTHSYHDVPNCTVTLHPPLLIIPDFTVSADPRLPATPRHPYPRRRCRIVPHRTAAPFPNNDIQPNSQLSKIRCVIYRNLTTALRYYAAACKHYVFSVVSSFSNVLDRSGTGCSISISFPPNVLSHTLSQCGISFRQSRCSPPSRDIRQSLASVS